MPYGGEADDDGLLSRAAAPVMDSVAEDIEGSGAGVVLTCSRGQVIGRRAVERRVRVMLDRVDLSPGAVYSEGHAGTNAIGMAIARSAPSVVAGSEHFAEVLGGMACAASPVTDSAGQLVGVLDLTCAAGEFQPLMLPLVKRAAAAIGQRLCDQARPQPGRRVLAERAGSPPPGWHSLTPAEWLVAGLVAEGLTNRAVAARLFLSPHTVDFHLRQVFRKLAIRSRTELARACESAGQAEMIAAADNARRRIERDLRDGLTRQLALLSARARQAGASASRDAEQLRGELTQVADALTGALKNVREIADRTAGQLT